MLQILLCVAILLFASPTLADTHTMSACSSAAWDTAYGAASNGDTVAFPAGSCSVTMTKDIAKTNLVVQGAGTSTTQVTGGFTCTSPTCDGLRITAIKFVTGPAFDIDGSEVASDIRLDHNYFYNGDFFTRWFVNVTNCLIDNNTFDTITGEGNYAFGTIARSSPGFPYTLGTVDALYFEDNIVINPDSMGHFIAQSRGGSRVVMRYNFFNLYQWDPFDVHDNYEGTSESGSATFEYYYNVLQYNGTGKRIFHVRGGQGVIWGNIVTGDQGGGIDWNSYVLCEEACIKGTSGICSWVNQGDYAWSNKHDCSSLASCDPHNMGACCAGGSTWGSEASCSGGGSSQQLVEDVDYFNLAMPGYTPYTYPHPLRGEGGSTGGSFAGVGSFGGSF